MLKHFDLQILKLIGLLIQILSDLHLLMLKYFDLQIQTLKLSD